ncbi:MAG: carbohydrate kinase [Verrucomicrobiota bacterium]
MESKGPVFCFGEVLWDCLPAGLFMGGAPCNVAYHIQQGGLEVYPVTAVGSDFLGEEILRRLKKAGLSDTFVTVIDHKSTGVVLVSIDEAGNATYEIKENVAWDHIGLTSHLEEIAHRASAIIFGSLALRALPNRAVLSALLNGAEHALKCFDVNLRPPFDDLELVRTLSEEADLIKMNADELKVLVDSENSSLEDMARVFQESVGDKKICITDGGNGAGLLIDDKWYSEKANKVEVKDTVGAGDSFLGALITSLVQGTEDPQSALSRACRMGEFVATSNGAMPSYKWQNNTPVALG